MGKSDQQRIAEKQELGQSEGELRRHVQELQEQNDRLACALGEALEQRAEALELHRRAEERLALLADASCALLPQSDDTAILAAILNLSDDKRVGIGIDISLRKHAEQAIRDREQRFRTLAEAMPAFVWTTRPDGGLTYVNHCWTEYTGLTLAATRGDGWRPTVHPDDLARMVAGGMEALETGAPHSLEFRCRRSADGEYRWFLCRIQPVRDESGTLLQWIWTSTDVDEQKHVQETLEEADRRKDQFLAMLGHELRTPLTIVGTVLDLLRRRSAGHPELDRLRERIGRQVGRMARLIDDLQDVTRIGSGKVLVRWEEVNLVDVVREAGEDHRIQIEAAGQSLRIELPDAAVAVRGDPSRLAQVLANLLNNATKFSDAGDAVTLRLDLDGDCARVTVEDTGLGIDAATLPHLFQSFVQAERSLERTRGGLGLGLALVRGLIELHHGEVTAASGGPGYGSAFTIRLPLAGTQQSGARG